MGGIPLQGLGGSKVSDWINSSTLIVPSRPTSGWAWVDSMTSMTNLAYNTGTWTPSIDGINGTIINQSETFVRSTNAINATLPMQVVQADLKAAGGWASGTETRMGVGFVDSSYTQGNIFGTLRNNLSSLSLGIIRDRVAWMATTPYSWTIDIWFTVRLSWNSTTNQFSVGVNGASSVTDTYTQTVGTLYPTIYMYRYNHTPTFWMKNLKYWCGTDMTAAPVA